MHGLPAIPDRALPTSARPRALTLALVLGLGAALSGCTQPERSTPTAPVAKASPTSPPSPASLTAKMAAGASTAPSATAPPAEPPTAPYDLDADRVQRAGAARRELGPRTTSAVVSDIFVVVGPPGWQGAAFDQSVALMRSSMGAYMNHRFSRKPEQAISVYLFADGASYESFCKKQYRAPCIAHYGFYSPSDRYMVMNAGLGLGTLTHEIVHPLVEADFPTAPTWLNEGIASLFEAPVIPKPGEIHGAKNWRHPRLKKAMTGAERDQARLDTLFGMADEVFRGDAEDRNYALARYVCQWLDSRSMLWPFYQRWRDSVATDPTGEKAFAAVVGKTPAEAHVDWAKWTLAL